MSETVRVIPPRLNLGRPFASTMAHCMAQYRDWKEGKIETHGRRTVMGFVLPDWQRGLVWTQEQKVALIESAWMGISIGTYTYNQAAIGSQYDYLLIDGQQRMSAIEGYITDQFPVFGYLFSELPVADLRRWQMSTAFNSYAMETEDEPVLRNYYNLMNFGGTAHPADGRA